MAKCPICGGTGDTTNNIPPTNEQWFCSLTTEEKAVVLDSIEHYARECENRHEYSCDNCDCPYCYNYQIDYEKWLKEKHDS